MRLRLDTGIGRAQLAEAAGMDLRYLCRIEDGEARPSIDMYAKLAGVLGASISSRLYPNTGPTIRDRHQARILEALLEQVHSRWRPYPEVGVRQPARGWIDLLLHAPREGTCVCTEIESDLRRIEQQLRWFREKVSSLPSWEGWPQLGEISPPSMLLMIRSTKSTRATGREFAQQLAAAYPAHPQTHSQR